MAYTVIPDVRAKLYDTIIPAAIAALPSTVTVSGAAYNLRVPDLYYGLPSTTTPPDSWVGIVGSTTADTPMAVFPATASRPQDEKFDTTLRHWYRVGDTDYLGQRIATESAYALYRTIFAQLRVAGIWLGVLTAPYDIYITNVHDYEWALAEGRAVGIEVTITVKSRV